MAFCPSGSRELLPLCSNPVKVSRDGYAGPNASIYIPFAGTRYFFSGAQYPAQPTIPQSLQRTMGGRRIPTTYSKGFTCTDTVGCG
jgi:hypothetical protein